MALIEWRDAFRTGIPAVDYEHAELIALLNHIHAQAAQRDAQAVGACLGQLHDAIAAHFALEETTMRAAGYAGLDRHKADHERLLDEVRDLMEEQYAPGGADPADWLSSRLEQWFMRHFHHEDARLHAAGI